MRPNCDRDRSDRKRSAAGLWRVSVLVCWQPQTELGELTHSPPGRPKKMLFGNNGQGDVLLLMFHMLWDFGTDQIV